MFVPSDDRPDLDNMNIGYLPKSNNQNGKILKETQLMQSQLPDLPKNDFRISFYD